MQSPFPLFSIRNLYLAAVSSCVASIIYLLIGTDGHAWSGAIRDTGFCLGITLNILGYLSLFQNRTYLNLIIWIVVTTAIFALLYLSFLYSLYDFVNRQKSNLSNDLLSVGLLIAFLIYAQFWKQALAVIIISTFTLPTTFFAIYIYLAGPLFIMVSGNTTERACLVQAGRTITSPTQFRLSLFIGEHTPRILEFSEGRYRIWRYSQRKFDHYRQTEYVPENCFPENIK